MILKETLPSVMTDNEQLYVTLLKVVIHYSDSGADVTINKTPDHFHVSITPSTDSFKDDIIMNCVGFHRLMNVKITSSKSTKLSKSYHFDVEFF